MFSPHLQLPQRARRTPTSPLAEVDGLLNVLDFSMNSSTKYRLPLPQSGTEGPARRMTQLAFFRHVLHRIVPAQFFFFFIYVHSSPPLVFDEQRTSATMSNKSFISLLSLISSLTEARGAHVDLNQSISLESYFWISNRCGREAQGNFGVTRGCSKKCNEFLKSAVRMRWLRVTR